MRSRLASPTATKTSRSGAVAYAAFYVCECCYTCGSTSNNHYRGYLPCLLGILLPLPLLPAPDVWLSQATNVSVPFNSSRTSTQLLILVSQPPGCTFTVSARRWWALQIPLGKHSVDLTPCNPRNARAASLHHPQACDKLLLKQQECIACVVPVVGFA